MNPVSWLKHHVSGSIERGENRAIEAVLERKSCWILFRNQEFAGLAFNYDSAMQHFQAKGETGFEYRALSRLEAEGLLQEDLTDEVWNRLENA